MITICTQGGLGNQLFQYAFGLAQAERLGVELGIDNTRNGLDTFRPFNLSLFNIPEKIVAHRDPTYEEKNLSYHPEVNEEIKDNEALIGYWQSEKYFKNSESLVRSRLTPYVNSPQRPWNRSALDFLGTILAAGNRSTLVAFRRTDYLKFLHFHGVMPDEYYTEALRVVAQTTPDPELFVFADDPNWVRENIQFPYPSHIFYNAMSVPGRMGREDVDLSLMSYCNNSIVANSSFHWWGTWLGDRKRTGVVVAPATWFTDPSAQANSGDIVPERWVRV
jgi:hypothetical protein